MFPQTCFEGNMCFQTICLLWKCVHHIDTRLDVLGMTEIQLGTSHFSRRVSRRSELWGEYKTILQHFRRVQNVLPHFHGVRKFFTISNIFSNFFTLPVHHNSKNPVFLVFSSPAGNSKFVENVIKKLLYKLRTKNFPRLYKKLYFHLQLKR